MKANHIIFVPGLFGWGPGELGGFPYWGDALKQFDKIRFTTHEAKCGPVSSFHDRACEVFARVKGTKVNYGFEHSTAEGHAQFSRDYTGQGFVPDWSADNPVVLIGHSAGAQTCLQLQQLLALDFWGEASNGNWVEAVICVAGVLDGSTLTYMFCDEVTGKLKGAPSFLIRSALDALEAIRKAARPVYDTGGDYDLCLDQWIGKVNPTNGELLAFFENDHRFADGEDNLAFDLRLQGCFKANLKFQTRSETYYFSVVTRATHEARVFDLPIWTEDAAARHIHDFSAQGRRAIPSALARFRGSADPRLGRGRSCHRQMARKRRRRKFDLAALSVHGRHAALGGRRNIRP